MKIADVENPKLKEGWLPDTLEHGGIQTIAWSDTPKSGKTWKADVVSSQQSKNAFASPFIRQVGRSGASLTLMVTGGIQGMYGSLDPKEKPLDGGLSTTMVVTYAIHRLAKLHRALIQSAPMIRNKALNS